MAPTRMIATISSEVPTGRSMKIRDGFMSRSSLLAGLRGLARSAAIGLATPLRRLIALGASSALSVGRRGGHRRTGCHARIGAWPADCGAVAQAVGPVDDDLVADLQPAQDLLLLAVSHTELDDADL